MLISDQKKQNTIQSAPQQDEKTSYWHQHVINYQQSKLSKQKYCDEHQINYPQFLYWRRKFVPEEASLAGASFVAVKIKPTALHHEALATLEFGDKRLIIHSEVGMQILLSHLG